MAGTQKFEGTQQVAGTRQIGGNPAWNRVGAMRRARRVAGLSQREMAARVGVAASTIARAEDPDGGASLTLIEAVLAVAGLRLAVVDAAGEVVAPMRTDVARNRAGSYFPAHLDTQVPAELTSRADPWRWDRPEPSVTFLRRSTQPCYPRAWAIPGLGNRDRPNDHYTADELAHHRDLRRARRRLRLAQAPPTGPSPLDAPCTCGPGCERHCEAACACQCEPARHADAG